ncbi:MAG: hypothetical protein JST05_03095 [Acidobacteria bacterium]|nr:hypothetical protein [Acidobacteriota bacterium]
MDEQETRPGTGAWPWIAACAAAVALVVRIIIMLRHPGGDGRPSANFHPWILWGGLPALVVSAIAFAMARRAKQPQGALIAGFVVFFNILMVFISL